MITSLSNPKIKEIRKLHDRKERRTSGLFYVEGLRPVIEVDQLGLLPYVVIISPELLTSRQGWELAEKWKDRGVTVLEVSEAVFRSIAVREDPVGIAVVMHQQWRSLDLIQPLDTDIWIALESVADPGNLGTIIRTLDAVAGKGVILLGNCTDPYDPTAVRASMGSIFSKTLVSASFDEFISWKEKNCCALIGTSDKAIMDFQELHYPYKLIILMGSERAGLQPSHLQKCDEVVRIPMSGRCDSLNLSVAASLVLYEVYNQRRRQKKSSLI